MTLENYRAISSDLTVGGRHHHQKYAVKPQSSLVGGKAGSRNDRKRFETPCFISEN